MQEGNLKAPVRNPVNWQDENYLNHESLYNELERVFDLCHGCRRCVSLCDSFPTLFDLIDESSTMELDSVEQKDYKKVVDACYLCDLCYMTKCPYTPPHEWNIDFPHLMLRAKAYYFNKQGVPLKDKILSSTKAVGAIASFPVVDNVVNKINNTKFGRSSLSLLLGVHKDAAIPKYYSKTARKLIKKQQQNFKPIDNVVLFITCYGEYNSPESVVDLVKVLNYNKVLVKVIEKEKCCGMPKLEQGNLEAVVNYGLNNVNHLIDYVNDGYKIISPIPSCSLMFKQELPLLLPEDKKVAKIAKAVMDPFEYLLMLHKKEQLNTDHLKKLDLNILYHQACHQRVQNIGAKTKEILTLIPGIKITLASRCSGHDGTYGVKKQSYKSALKICTPITKNIDEDIDYISSDCVMAGNHISHTTKIKKKLAIENLHPITILKKAYGMT